MLLCDAIVAYAADRQARGEISAASARQFAWRLHLLARAHPGLEVADLTRDHVLEWQRTVGDQRAATRRGYLSTVRTFCAWAVDSGLLVADPSVRVAKVRDPRGEPRNLSASSRLARLAMVLPDERATLIVLLMCQLGLRCVEVARLTVADWDPYAAELRVIGKGGHVRYGQVLDDLAAMLDRRCAGRSGLIVEHLGRAGLDAGVEMDGPGRHQRRPLRRHLGSRPAPHRRLQPARRVRQRPAGPGVPRSRFAGHHRTVPAPPHQIRDARRHAPVPGRLTKWHGPAPPATAGSAMNRAGSGRAVPAR